MMHNCQAVGSRAGIYFVHAVYFKKKSLCVSVRFRSIDQLLGVG